MKLLMILVLYCILVFSVASADVWYLENVDSNSSILLNRSSIALDAGGNARISYQACVYETSSDLKYAYWNGTNWAISIIDSNVSGDGLAEYNSLALDSEGKPRIAYNDRENGYIKYASWSGSFWDITIVDTGLGEYVSGSSLCLDSEDTPSIVYSYDYNDRDLMYARWYESAWYISAIDIPGKVGLWSSMDLASNDKPHVSYCDNTNDNLKYAYLGPEFWHIFTIDSVGDVGHYTSIAVDSNDRVHISYFDETNCNLKYAYYNGTTWNISTIDSDGDVGRYCTSIAVDSNNNPHISYYDFTNDCLKYAYHNGSTWELSVVDVLDHAGRRSSIAVDSEDRPHISYTATQGGYFLLRYAYYGPEGIEEEEGGSLPDGFTLYNANPNPCPGFANISFAIPVSSNINLDIYDITGRKVAVLAEGVFSTGLHEVEISGLSTGIYFCVLRTGDFIDTRTIAVIK